MGVLADVEPEIAPHGTADCQRHEVRNRHSRLKNRHSEPTVTPDLPEGFGHFRADNIPFAGNSKLAINISKDTVEVAELPDSVKLRLEARPALLELLNLSRMK